MKSGYYRKYGQLVYILPTKELAECFDIMASSDKEAMVELIKYTFSPYGLNSKYFGGLYLIVDPDQETKLGVIVREGKTRKLK